MPALTSARRAWVLVVAIALALTGTSAAFRDPAPRVLAAGAAATPEEMPSGDESASDTTTTSAPTTTTSPTTPPTAAARPRVTTPTDPNQEPLNTCAGKPDPCTIPPGTAHVRGRVLDATGAPLSGLCVLLTVDGYVDKQQTTTAADGSYAADMYIDLPPRWVTVSTSDCHNPANPRIARHSDDVRAYARGSYVLDLVTMKPSILFGTIYRNDGTPLENHCISISVLRRQEPDRLWYERSSGMTDSGGGYRFNDLPTGSFQVLLLIPMSDGSCVPTNGQHIHLDNDQFGRIDMAQSVVEHEVRIPTWGFPPYQQ